MAHGFEIVHTHFEGWRFTARPTRWPTSRCTADCSSAHACRWPGWTTLGTDLAALTMVLECEGREVDRGVGANVLDGPLDALRLWVDAMAAHTPDTAVRAGELVTTGTLTDAWPLAPGQAWRTRLGGDRLPGLSLRFVA